MLKGGLASVDVHGMTPAMYFANRATKSSNFKQLAEGLKKALEDKDPSAELLRRDKHQKTFFHYLLDNSTYVGSIFGRKLQGKAAAQPQAVMLTVRGILKDYTQSIRSIQRDLGDIQKVAEAKTVYSGRE